MLLWHVQEDDADADMPDAGAGQPDIIDGPAQPSDKPKITTRYVTKYERARVLGTRALQIRSVSAECILSIKANFCSSHATLTWMLSVLCVLLCSMNAPVMVEVGTATDPLEVSNLKLAWCLTCEPAYLWL